MIKRLPLILLLLTVSAAAQDESPVLEKLRSLFQSFTYNEVIELSDSILNDTDAFDSNQLAEVYLYRAASFYNLWDEESAEDAFIHLLQLNKDYVLDKSTFSPKIITFYNEIKSEYLQSIRPPDTTSAKEDTLQIMTTAENEELLIQQKEMLTGISVRSMLLPGWGHIYRDESTLSGWLLTGASILTLGSTLYYFYETDNKRDAYLNAIEQAEIDKAYEEYNDAYLFRNYSLIAFITVWIYAQLDIHFFSQDHSGRSDLFIDVSSFRGTQINLKYNF